MEIGENFLLTTITDDTTKPNTKPPCIGGKVAYSEAFTKRPIHPKNSNKAVPKNSAINISKRVEVIPSHLVLGIVSEASFSHLRPKKLTK